MAKIAGVLLSVALIIVGTTSAWPLQPAGQGSQPYPAREMGLTGSGGLVRGPTPLSPAKAPGVLQDIPLSHLGVSASVVPSTALDLAYKSPGRTYTIDGQPKLLQFTIKYTITPGSPDAVDPADSDPHGQGGFNLLNAPDYVEEVAGGLDSSLNKLADFFSGTVILVLAYTQPSLPLVEVQGLPDGLAGTYATAFDLVAIDNNASSRTPTIPRPRFLGAATLHELFHWVQDKATPGDLPASAPGWVYEGTASWAELAIGGEKLPDFTFVYDPSQPPEQANQGGYPAWWGWHYISSWRLGGDRARMAQLLKELFGNWSGDLQGIVSKHTGIPIPTLFPEFARWYAEQPWPFPAGLEVPPVLYFSPTPKAVIDQNTPLPFTKDIALSNLAAYTGQAFRFRILRQARLTLTVASQVSSGGGRLFYAVCSAEPICILIQEGPVGQGVTLEFNGPKDLGIFVVSSPGIPQGSLSLRVAASEQKGFVKGKVKLQGREDTRGAFVEVDGVVFGLNPDGTFAIELPVGTRQVSIKAPGYLFVSRPVEVLAGKTATLPEATLLIGDLNGNGRIDILDLVLLSKNFGQVGPGPWPGEATY